MNLLKRYAPLLAAVFSLALLVYFLLGDQVAERRIPLMILSALSLIWFSRPNALATIMMIIPVGPILDSAFLTSGRGIYATEAIMLTAIAIWMVHKARLRQTWKRPTLPVLLLCIYALAGVVALLAGNNSLFSNLRMLRQLFLTAMIALLVQDLISREQILDRLQKHWAAATLLGLAILALGGIAEFFKTHSEPGSFYGGSVTLAVHVAFFSPLALSIWLSSWSRLWRMAAAATWLLSMICLPLTASRGAMGSVLITSLALLLISSLRGRRLKWPALSLILIIAVAGGVLLGNPQLAGDNFAYKVNASLKGDFFSTRTSEWKQAMASIKTSPFIGEGPEASSHSIPLELAQRGGIAAALLMLAAVLAAMIASVRGNLVFDFSEATISWGIALGLLGFLLVGLAETGLGARTSPLLALVIAMTIRKKTIDM